MWRSLKCLKPCRSPQTQRKSYPAVAGPCPDPRPRAHPGAPAGRTLRRRAERFQGILDRTRGYRHPGGFGAIAGHRPVHGTGPGRAGTSSRRWRFRRLRWTIPPIPPQLKQIYDPPLILYVRGNVEALAQPGIAVVGTRHPTPYGSGMAERLACDLAARGLVIFSGMARGVDTAAHRGAITAKGKTVAVFGTGVDVIYPKENTRLAEQMLALGGALISEFPLGTFAAPQNFPIRNRIISGMSIGVLVVEAARIQRHAHHRALRSGAESRRLRRARQRHQQEFLGTEHPDQTGRQAGRDLGRRLGGTPDGCATCADSGRRR